MGPGPQGTTPPEQPAAWQREKRSPAPRRSELRIPGACPALRADRASDYGA